MTKLCKNFIDFAQPLEGRFDLARNELRLLIHQEIFMIESMLKRRVFSRKSCFLANILEKFQKTAKGSKTENRF